MYDYNNHPSHMNPANTPNVPATIEDNFVTEIDGPNDIPSNFHVSYAYQSDGRRAIIDCDIEIVSEMGFMFDVHEQVKEAIEERLGVPCEFK